MLTWLKENLGTIVVLGIIAFAVIINIIHQAKKPSGGACSGCSGCGSGQSCSDPEQLKKLIEEYDRKKAQSSLEKK